MNKITFGVLALLAVGALFATTSVMAYRGESGVQGPNFSEERHAEMTEAFENADYAAWYDLMTENDRQPRIVEVVTAENFAEFAEAHNAFLEGDKTLMQEFREENGLGLGQMKRGNGKAFAKGFERGFGRGHEMGQRTCPYTDAE